jgi:23S rRNA (uracil1939-C5)-methyltransferase
MRKGRQPLEAELSIDRLASGGRGVGRLESGEVAFVRGGMPGDRVLARLGARRKRHREGTILELLSSSPHRVEARCEHQAVCGGCPLQTLSYEEQLSQKHQMIVDAWSRVGGLQVPDLPPIMPAKELWYYRNKMEFGFSDRQWCVDPDDPQGLEFGLGQHVPGIFSKVFDLKSCWLQSEWTAPILEGIREFVRDDSPELVWNWITGSGYWRFIVMREGKATGERMLNIITGTHDKDRVRRLAEHLMERFPDHISTIVQTVNTGKGQVANGDLHQIIVGDGLLREELLGRRFELAPPAFFQTNTLQAEHLFDLACEMAAPSGDEIMLDLYCGTGSLAILMSDRVREAHGVELVPEAVVSAKRNAEINNLDNLHFHAGDVKDLLKSKILPQPDLCLVDPPRGGLHPKVVTQLVDMAAPKLLYISCNPVTQARDAALLIEGGYVLRNLRGVDMFPHTAHVETVALFEWRGGVPELETQPDSADQDKEALA